MASFWPESFQFLAKTMDYNHLFDEISFNTHYCSMNLLRARETAKWVVLPYLNLQGRLAAVLLEQHQPSLSREHMEPLAHSSTQVGGVSRDIGKVSAALVSEGCQLEE